jgi:DHA1 family inner membrane transport protein
MSSFRTPLAVLAVGALVLGTSELGVAGLLPAIGAGLRVSAGSAGLLVTAYAVAVAVGGPVLTALLRRFGHRRVLVGALLAMAAGNALTAAAGWYPAVLGARALTGAASAVYAAAALGAAGAVAGPARQGRAVAVVFGGVAVSSVLGVPLCNLLGDWIGWRAVYLALAAAALTVVPAILHTLPAPSPQPPSPPANPADHRAALANGGTGPDRGAGPGGRGAGRVWRGWFGAARPRRLGAVFGVNAAVQAAQYAVGTYLVVMVGAAGLRGGAVAAVLLGAGIAGVGGTAVGGRLSDRHARRTVVASAAALAGVLAVVPAVLGNPVLLPVAAVAWTVAAAAFSTAAQVCVAEEVGVSGGVAASANISVSNVGIATGSALGGAALRLVGPSGPALLGAIMAAAGAAGALALLTRRPPTTPPRTHHPDTRRQPAAPPPRAGAEPVADTGVGGDDRVVGERS